MQSCVASSNRLGYGPVSECDDVEVIGPPGYVPFEIQKMMDLDDGDFLKVTWTPPTDWGRGEGVFTGIEITRYEVVLSTCSSFKMSLSCTIKYLEHSPAECSFGDGPEETRCEMLIPELNNLLEGVVYYLYVRAENAGVDGRPYTGYLWKYQRFAWKLIPTIVVPAVEDFPLRAVEWDRSTSIWYQNSPRPSVLLTVDNYPRVKIASLANTEVYADVAIGERIFTLPVEVNSREKINEDADLDDPLGIGVRTELTFVAPRVDGLLGMAVVTFRVDSRTLPQEQDTAWQAFEIVYFAYPLPTVELFPNFGDIDGNVLVQIEIDEPIGIETREAAGMITFVLASKESMAVYFAMADERWQTNSISPVEANLEEVSSSNGKVSITLRTPYLDGSSGPAQVSFKVCRVEDSICEFMPTDPTSVVFTYGRTFIRKIMPASGLTIGGTPLTVLVIGIPTDPSHGIIAANIIRVEAFIAGEACVSVLFDTSIPGQLSLTCVSPAVDSSTRGFVEVVVKWYDASNVMESASSDSLFSYVGMPILSIEDVKIGGMAPDVDIAVSKPTQISFTLRFFLSSVETLTVNIGGKAATQVKIKSFNSGDIRTSYSIIECLTPTDGAAGDFPIVVRVVSARFGSRTAESETKLTFIDLNAPRIFEAQPSGGRMAGGQVIIASVWGLCPGPCPPGGITVQFEGQAAPVLGSITLKDWKAGVGNSAYDTLRGTTLMSNFFSTITVERRAQIEEVVEGLDKNLQILGLATAADKAFIVFFRAPGSLGPTDATRTTSFTVSAQSRSASSSYTLFANPVGPAVVLRALPTTGSIVGGRRVSVTLSNFLIVNTAADFRIVIGGLLANLDTANIQKSNNEVTELTFITPPFGRAGQVTVEIFPEILKGNQAEFDFTYQPKVLPGIPDVLQEEVYTTGGETVTITVTNFGFAEMLPQDAVISVQQGENDKILLTGFSATYDTESKSSTFTITTIALPAGPALVFISIPFTSQNVVADLKYSDPPTSPPQMGCLPSTGPTVGGTVVTCVLSNFRKVTGPKDLALTFGSVTGMQADSVKSSVRLTEVTFKTPDQTFRGAGEVVIQITALAAPGLTGESKFNLFDPGAPTLLYSMPRAGVGVRPNSVQVGIGNLGRAFDSAADFLASATTIAQDGLPSTTLSVTVMELQKSTDKASHLTLQIAALPTGQDYSQIQRIELLVRITVPGFAQTPVEFSYLYEPADRAVMVSYSPTSYFADGRVPLYMRVVNSGTFTLQDGAYVDFGPNAKCASSSSPPKCMVTSITVLSGGAMDITANVPTLQVSIAGDELAVTPRLIVPQSASAVGLEVPFAQPFIYKPSPDPRIASIFPQKGSVSTRTEVEIEVRSLPGVTTIASSEFIVEVVQDRTKVQAQIIAYDRVDPGRSELEIQTVKIRVRTPCCNGQIVAGNAAIYVHHIDYPTRVARTSLDTSFLYYDDSQPFVEEVAGDFGGPLIKFVGETQVTMQVANVLNSFTTVALKPRTETYSFEYLTSDTSYNLEQQRAKLIFLFLSSTARGLQEVRLVLDEGSPTQRETSFIVDFYNQKKPILSGVAPRSGSIYEKTLVTVYLSNFPIVTAQDLLVRVGDDVIDGNFGTGIDIVVSSLYETRLTVVLDAIGETGPKTVTVFPLGRESKAVTFDFDFFAVAPSVQSVNKQSICSAGGDLSVSIGYFHPVLSGPELEVVYDGKILGVDDVAVSLSSREETQLRIKFPPSLPCGCSRTVTMVPKALGLSGRVSFDIQVKDANGIDFDELSPIPSEACLREGGALLNLYLKNVPSDASVDDIAVSYQGQAFLVTKVIFRTRTSSSEGCGDTKHFTDVEFRIPAIFLPTPGSRLTVSYAALSSTISTPFIFKDCSVPTVESVSPSSGINQGGSTVLVYVKNLAPYDNALDLFVRFNTIEFKATSVEAMQGSLASDSVPLARVEFVLPEVPFAWQVTGYLLQSDGLSAGLNISFDFLFESPCDYEQFCGAKSLIAHELMLLESPPMDAACDLLYCLALEDVPSPFLVSVTPAGDGDPLMAIADSKGDTVMTLLMTGFPAVKALEKISVQVGDSVDGVAAPVKSMTVLLFGGAAGLDSRVEVQVQVPPGAGIKTGQLVVDLGAGDENPAVSFKVRYVKAIVGSIAVVSFSPESIFAGAENLVRELTVEMTNVPRIAGPLTEETAKQKLRLEIRSGSSTVFTTVAASIFESTYDGTKASFLLPPAPGGLAAGTYTVSVAHTDSSSDRAGTFPLTVSNLGSPEVLSVYPAKFVVDTETEASISIKYLPQSPSNLRVEILRGATWQPVTVIEDSQRNSPGCSRRSCNTASLGLSVMLTGVLGESELRVCASGLPSPCSGSVLIQVLSKDQTQVTKVFPNRGPSTGLSQTIFLFVTNFPASVSEGGRAVAAADIVVKMDGVSYDVSEVEHGLGDSPTTITFKAPMAGQVLDLQGASSRTLAGIVYVQGDVRDVKRGSFEYTIERPEGTVSPVDASAAGGDTVTVRLFWGFPLTVEDVTADLVPADATVTVPANVAIVNTVTNFGSDGNVVSADPGSDQTVAFSDVSLILRGPMQGVFGSSAATLTISSYSSSEAFEFEIFEAPAIRTLLPAEATLEGETEECKRCVFHNKRSVSLWVTGLPKVASSSDLLINFGEELCGTPTSSCAILSLKNQADSLYLALSVPPAAQSGPVTIRVSFIGKGPPPAGSVASDSYVRSVREATTDAFTYVASQPGLVSALYCEGENNKVAGTACEDGSTPLAGSETDTLLPLRGSGSFTMTLENVASILTADTEILVKLGSTSAIATVVSSTDKITVIQVSFPPDTTPTGAQQGSIELSETVSLPFSALVFDESIRLYCVTPNAPFTKTDCISRGDDTLTVRLEGLNIGRPSDLYKNIVVSIGSVQAKDVTWECCPDAETILKVPVPSLETTPELRINLEDGRVELDLMLALADDKSRFAVSKLTMFAPPELQSAVFESSGTALLLTFDQPTDEPAIAGSDCAAIVSSSSSLGTGALCAWRSARVLRVALGQLAGVLPGDSISLASSAVVRSQNGLSNPASSAKAVMLERPFVLLVPGPARVLGPTSVDPCGGIELSFILPSPRELTYSWTCVNNEALDGFLRRQSMGDLRLAPGTPELPLGDFTYEIRAKARDFLGVHTEPLTVNLFKASSPQISLVIDGQETYLTTKDVVVSGSGAFSECRGAKQGKLSYSWEVTRAAVSDADRASVSIPENRRASPELYFPPRNLPGGLQYGAVLTVTNEEDPSQRSSASFPLQMRSPGLVAMIAGGTSMTVSRYSTLLLDASASYDPEGDMSSEPMRFQWTCVLRVGELDMPCINQLEAAKAQGQSTPVFVPPREALLSITPETLEVTGPGAAYIFTVLVSRGARVTTASTSVTVVEERIPTASITSTSFEAFDEETGFPKMNAEARINLEQMAVLQEEVLLYAWTVDTEVPEVNGAACADSAVCREVAPMLFQQAKFVLRPALSSAPLFVSSSTYRIKLEATNTANGLSAENVMTLAINEPPTSGSCSVCNLNALAFGTCDSSGIALIDFFRVACQMWSDADLPLTYIFGFEMNGEETTMAPKRAPFLDQLLPAGVTVITAQVVDSLGAGTAVQRLPVTVTSAGTQRRTEAWRTGVENAMEEARKAGLAGNAAQVNALAVIVAVSMESLRNSFVMTQRRSTRQTLEQLIADGMSSAAPTVSYAAETMGAGAKVAYLTCELTSAAFDAALSIVPQMAAVSTSDDAFPSGFVQDAATLLGALSAASFISTADCNADQVQVPFTQLHNMLRIRHNAAALALAGFVQTNVVGEGQTAFASVDVSPSARRSVRLAVNRRDLRTTKGQLAVDGGYAGVFRIPRPLSSPQLTGTHYDVMTAEGLLPRNKNALLAGADVIASPSSVTMTILDPGTKQQVGVTNLDPPITVMLSTYQVLNNHLGIGCAFYQQAPPQGTGTLSFDGCAVRELADGYVRCECTHLTEFMAAVNPDNVLCGDGTIHSTEECDDGNTHHDDGCSPGCDIEPGAVCWTVDNSAGAFRSECCAPCAPGSYRDGCVFQGDGSDGECKLCPENTFKNATGNWDSRCTPCPAGKQSGLGATSCGNEPPCPAGQFRAAEGLPCQDCRPGTFKQYEGSSNDQCAELLGCAPGYSLVDYSASKPGRCEKCPISTYKERWGLYDAQCKPCPSNSSSNITGATSRETCTCGSGFVRSNKPLPYFCDDINECVKDSSFGEDAGKPSGICQQDPPKGTGNNVSQCINTAGSYVCSSECGDGFVVGHPHSNEWCDDGNGNDGDGCSSTCVIEPNFDCTPGCDNSCINYNNCTKGCTHDTASVCVCESGWYSVPGAPCSVQCNAAVKCNGNGACTGNGYCACKRTYFEFDCSVQLTPIDSISLRITDITMPATLRGNYVLLELPAYALKEPVTIFADTYNTSDLPPGMQRYPSSASARRQCSAQDWLGGWRFAGPVSQLTPSATTVNNNPKKNTRLTLKTTPGVADTMLASEVLCMYTYNVEARRWQKVPGSYGVNTGSGSFAAPSFGQAVAANLTTLGYYVPVIEGRDAVIVTPDEEPYKVPDGVIAAAVVVPVVLLAAAAFAYKRHQDKKKADAAAKAKAEPVIESEVGFDASAAARAGTTPGARPEAEPEAEPEEDAWQTCTGCQNPVRASWPRCPKCRTKIEKEAVDAGAAETRELAAGVGGEETRPREAPAVEAKDSEEWIECSECKNPIKMSWPRCPTCRTDTSKKKEEEEAWIDCIGCKNPMKPTWPRCPTCKTDTATTLAALKGADDKAEVDPTPRFQEITTARSAAAEDGRPVTPVGGQESGTRHVLGLDRCPCV